MKKRIIILIIATVLIVGQTFLAWPISGIENTIIKRCLGILLNYANGAVALIAIRLTGVEIGFEPKDGWQYLIGLAIALTLSLFIAFIPAWTGNSLVGSHTDFDWGNLIYSLLFFLLVIGPVEELIFRVYYQETFIGFFKKNKWIGVIIAAALFGLFHLINGSWLQVLFTFGIGAVFGFCKYLLKHCKYLGLSFGHGLYDFLNVIVRMFVI